MAQNNQRDSYCIRTHEEQREGEKEKTDTDTYQRWCPASIRLLCYLLHNSLLSNMAIERIEHTRRRQENNERIREEDEKNTHTRAIERQPSQDEREAYRTQFLTGAVEGDVPYCGGVTFQRLLTVPIIFLLGPQLDRIIIAGRRQ